MTAEHCAGILRTIIEEMAVLFAIALGVGSIMCWAIIIGERVQ